MESYTADTYGERIAGVYDDRYPDAAPGQIDLLADLAGDGPVLELGIGTGRLALPLAGRGIAIQGLDASPAMVDRLRAKPGGTVIPVTIGDFADFDLPQRFSLVFVAFNTLFGLPGPEAQLGCFAAVARHLAPGGRFLAEAFVPDPGLYDRGQRVAVRALELDRVDLECSVHDAAAQRVSTQHVSLGRDGVHLYPVRIRYAWPAELDLMARLAGLPLEHRWAGWQRQPFGPEAAQHVSVWRRPV